MIRILRFMLVIIVTIILLFVIMFSVGYFYGSRHFVVREQTIQFDQLPDAFDGYRICQFSDFHAFSFHCGHEDDVQRVVDLINAQHCDLIVFTGDIVARAVTSYTFDAPLHSSWLFYYGKDADALRKAILTY